MHRHSRGQLRHGTVMTAEEKRRQSKERRGDDLQRLGKAERWQGYVRHGLAALRTGTDTPCKAKEQPRVATSSSGKARRCSSMRRNGTDTKHKAMELHRIATERQGVAVQSIGMAKHRNTTQWDCKAKRSNGYAMRVDAAERRRKAPQCE